MMRYRHKMTTAGSFLNRWVFAALALAFLSLNAPSAHSACYEINLSTCVGDFGDGGDLEDHDRLIGNASVPGYSLGILQGNKSRIFIASGTPRGYDYRTSTPTTTGFVGISMDGISQIPQYHLDVWGMFRSTDSAFLATSTGSVGIGTLSPASKLQVWMPAGTTTWQLFKVSTGSSDMFSINSSSIIARVPIVLPDGTILSSVGGAVWSASGNDAYYNQLGNVGIGTSTPNVKLQVSRPNGSTGPALVVSTGSTKMMEVNGSSIGIGVPLVFPDGSSLSRGTSLTDLYISSFGALNVAPFGTGNTKIIVFSSATTNGPFISSGTDVAVNYGGTAAVVGSSITILTAGRYEFAYTFSDSANQQYGLSINASPGDLSTNIQSIAAGNRFCGSLAAGTGADNLASHTCTLRLNSGDVVRFHAQGGTVGSSTTKLNFFKVTKLSD